MIEILQKEDSVEFKVRVVPRASRTEITGEFASALRIRIASAPVDGAANDELICFLAKTFGTAKTSVEIIGGQTSKTKRIRIMGISAEQAKSTLGL